MQFGECAAGINVVLNEVCAAGTIQLPNVADIRGTFSTSGYSEPRCVHYVFHLQSYEYYKTSKTQLILPADSLCRKKISICKLYYYVVILNVTRTALSAQIIIYLFYR